MRIELRESPFDPYAEVSRFQSELLAPHTGQYGATSLFVGTMRDFNEGDTVEKLWLEHYPGMTERELARILDEAAERWPFLEALVIHRFGAIEPGENIVLIAIWSAHRSASMEATRHIIEALKHRAPFWKRETLAQGYRWVEKNTAG
ncbi:MAG: molybdenum cofactor biosynthesis protein MoaE [Methylococcaceae bacterium]|jgi:Molybdopterin converting factor, large subunit|nr:molybdenum cofactor biosynthesis protein MoaE [Methylococcaceae bacterium]